MERGKTKSTKKKNNSTKSIEKKKTVKKSVTNSKKAKKKKSKAFTLIELLAVIIILGILMIIAIPSVSKYISDSRKNAYIQTAKEIIGGARTLVNQGKLEMYDTDTTYYLASECIQTENSSRSPYGDFLKAYVVVTYNGKGYDYYWTSVDDAGQGIRKITKIEKLDVDLIESDLTVNDISDSVGIDGRNKYMIINKADSNCGKSEGQDVTDDIIGETGESSSISCEAGKYLPMASETCSECLAGSFCKGGRYKYNESSNQGIAECVKGSYSEAGASSCTACTNGKTTSGVGKTSCNADCSNKYGVDTWTTATWNSNNTISNLCKISTCKNLGTGVYTLRNNGCYATTTIYFLYNDYSYSIRDNQNISTSSIPINQRTIDKNYLLSNNGTRYSFMYFKFEIENNIVKNRYVCFTITSQMHLPNTNPGEYCLKSKSGNTTYQQNVSELKRAFGNNNSYCTDSSTKYECKKTTYSRNMGAFEYSCNSSGTCIAKYDEPLNGNAFPSLTITTSGISYSGGGCLSGDTEVDVYDRKKKRRYRKKLRDVTNDDLILCWNFDNGEFTYVEPLWIKKAEIARRYYLLEFSDGSELKVVGDHKLFDVDRNKFINAGNENELNKGSHVYNSKGEIVELLSWKAIEEETDSYNVITNYHMNMFANGILTSCVFSNIYEIENMRYKEHQEERLTNVDLEGIDLKYINGLRLNEVPSNFRGNKKKTISYVKKYIDNLIAKEK